MSTAYMSSKVSLHVKDELSRSKQSIQFRQVTKRYMLQSTMRGTKYTRKGSFF